MHNALTGGYEHNHVTTHLRCVNVEDGELKRRDRRGELWRRGRGAESPSVAHFKVRNTQCSVYVMRKGWDPDPSARSQTHGCFVALGRQTAPANALGAPDVNTAPSRHRVGRLWYSTEGGLRPHTLRPHLRPQGADEVVIPRRRRQAQRHQAGGGQLQLEAGACEGWWRHGKASEGYR